MDKTEATRKELEREHERERERTNSPQATRSLNDSDSKYKVIPQGRDTQIRTEIDDKSNPIIETVPKDEVESGMEISKALEFANKMHWIRLVNESVHSSDDEDIGDIDAVSRDFVVCEKRICTCPLLLHSNK